MKETQIIASILEGNTHAFAKLVEKHSDMAFSIAFRILQNTEDSEEATQDAFMKAFNGLKSFRKEAKFSTWLYQIVYHSSINRMRTQFKETTYEDYSDNTVTNMAVFVESFVDLESQNRKEIIERTLQKMPADESLLLTLFYLDSSSIEEIETITGWSKANVKVKLFRARKRFYELLTEYMKSEIKMLL